MGAGKPLVWSVCALLVAAGAGCGSGRLGDPADGGAAGGVSIVGAGGGAGAGIGVGTGIGNATGTGVLTNPCLGTSDARLVIAPQRTLLMTGRETINMVRALVDDTEATALVAGGVFAVTADVDRHFPPADGEPTQIPDASSMMPYTRLANHVAQYVFDNFATLTACTSPGRDDCATAFLAAFTAKAYRRPIDATELGEVTAQYGAARATQTAEQATQQTIAWILVQPKFLFRSEQGDPTHPSVAPPGIPLTQYELASALSFFLTDGPPDQPLLDAAAASTLVGDGLVAQADRILATQASHDWLRTIMDAYFRFNWLPSTLSSIDPSKFPVVSPALATDLQTEADLFLDSVLWNRPLTELLTSQTTFLNASLASAIYNVPVPPGATQTSWVQTTLPPDQRMGLLTSAPFLILSARSSGEDMVARGLAISQRMLCRDVPPPPDSILGPGSAEDRAVRLLPTQTAQEQAAFRAQIPVCASCHADFDPYGLTFDAYDDVGRYRTVDGLGKPVDAHATLPPLLGSAPVANALQLAPAIARSPQFTNCLATSMLQYAMVNDTAWVEPPDPAADKAGCAAADVAGRFRAGASQTFRDLLLEVVRSPAFSLRAPLR